MGVPLRHAGRSAPSDYIFQVSSRCPFTIGPLTDFVSFRTLLSYVQKAHFKSTHIQKLHLALDVYRGLGAIPATRADTLAKVTSMLLHPFPKV